MGHSIALLAEGGEYRTSPGDRERAALEVLVPISLSIRVWVIERILRRPGSPQRGYYAAGDHWIERGSQVGVWIP